MSATLHDFPRNQSPKPAPEASAGRSPGADSPASELDGRIRDVLVRLPRERASEGFTAQVVVRASGARAARVGRLRSLAAAAVFFAVSAVGVHEWNAAQGRQAAAERIASLQAEYDMLHSELLALKRAADARRPVVYLGGDADVEYVLDLSRLAPSRTPADSPRAAVLGLGVPSAGPIPVGTRPGASASARPTVY
ncbi:MAG: hypothetical protein AAGF23_21010 [Acidobacteriota bacterium]